MSKELEQKIRKCRTCSKKTLHQRTIKKPDMIWLLIHIFLAIPTFGIWLVVVMIWRKLKTPIGGWACSECGT